MRPNLLVMTMDLLAEGRHNAALRYVVAKADAFCTRTITIDLRACRVLCTWSR